jgi:hypothetical protein
MAIRSLLSGSVGKDVSFCASRDQGLVWSDPGMWTFGQGLVYSLRKPGDGTDSILQKVGGPSCSGLSVHCLTIVETERERWLSTSLEYFYRQSCERLLAKC